MKCNETRATLIILDGARPDVFEYLLAAGDLPTISRHVCEPGGAVPATTVFPSTTGVAYLPFLTGCYPGTCNLPGIRWLDTALYAGAWWRHRAHVRSYCGYQGRLLDGDVSDRVLSLFDVEPDSVALCTPFNRHLPRARQRACVQRTIYGSLAHFTTGYGILDRAVGRALARVARQRHRLVFAVFPAVDGIAHSYDPSHPRVQKRYREFDRALAEYVRRGGFAGDHLAVLASDHGMSRILRHTDVARVLESRGLATLRHPILWRRNPRVAVMVSGNASAQVYLQPGIRRTTRWSVSAIEAGKVQGIPADFVKYLASLSGVALVAGVEGPDVVVCSRDGEARLVDEGDGSIRYEPATADVLELGPHAVTRSAQEWLVESYNHRFPDGPVQLLQLFRSPRAGDLAISAAGDSDLRDAWEFPEHRSGHGGLVREHMRCLLAINRPATGPMRTVDVFPTVLTHLGHEIPYGIDGVAAALGNQTHGGA